MKTWIVREPDEGPWSYIVNAVSAIEAVQFALARTGKRLRHYSVWDHDLNPTMVDVHERILLPLREV